MVAGAGTALNVGTVLLGTACGAALGARLPDRVGRTVTDALGLVVLLVAGLQAADVVPLARPDALGRTAVLVVLGAVLLGGLAGSLLRLEERLEGVGEALQRRLGGRGGADEAVAAAAAERFVQGFVVASLVFCVGPLAILGALQDGLSGDIELLAVKSALDGFASLAFAAALGWGVGASALTVLVYQGGLTAAAVLTGDVLSDVVVSSITAVGGLLLVGVALRLLNVRDVPVGDMLPALLLAPLITVAVQAVR